MNADDGIAPKVMHPLHRARHWSHVFGFRHSAGPPIKRPPKRRPFPERKNQPWYEKTRKASSKLIFDSLFHSSFTISHAFHSLFRLLFIFRSHYLFAIGLDTVFRLLTGIRETFALESQPARLFGHRCLSRAHVSFITSNRTGLSPSMAPSPTGIRTGEYTRSLAASQLQICRALWHNGHTTFRMVLFPLHSPLLRESLLFSFPGVNNMLKFTPYSICYEGL